MTSAKDPLEPVLAKESARVRVDSGRAEDEMSRSPLLVLFGLAVVWGSLYLVAIAQSLSNAPKPPPAPAVATPAPEFAVAASPTPTPPPTTEPMLAAVESMNLKEIPARQIVKDLLYKAHLHIEAEELNKISAEARELHFEGRPLYECLYSALGQEDLGLSVAGDQVRFIEQKISHEVPDHGPLEQYNWETDLTLGADPVSLYPSGRSPLWIRLRLLAPPAAAGGRVGFEIYRGELREGSGEGLLPQPGVGAIRFVAGDAISLRIENRSPAAAPEGEAVPPLLLNVRLQYHTPTETAEGTPAPTPTPAAAAPGAG